MRTILVAGGGYAGFYTAWKLEKKLRRDEARVVVVDPRPYMTVIKGFPAWLMHRGYHVLAVPTWERKIRVLAVWLTAAVSGRDIVSLAAVQDPRRAFVADGEPAEPGPAERAAPLLVRYEHARSA
jgi:NADH dehydrogenase FAD-containing subunit